MQQVLKLAGGAFALTAFLSATGLGVMSTSGPAEAAFNENRAVVTYALDDSRPAVAPVEVALDQFELIHRRPVPQSHATTAQPCPGKR